MPFPDARDIQLNKQSLDTLLTTQMTAKEAPRMPASPETAPRGHSGWQCTRPLEAAPATGKAQAPPQEEGPGHSHTYVTLRKGLYKSSSPSVEGTVGISSSSLFCKEHRPLITAGIQQPQGD